MVIHKLYFKVYEFPDLSISEEAEQIIDNIRHEIFENLQSYYQNELGLTDFSVRLGNLMSLNHTIQVRKYEILKNENIRFIFSGMPFSLQSCNALLLVCFRLAHD